MNRQAQAAVLFLLGTAVLRVSSTDIYLRYVKAGLRPLLILAGITLIVTAAVTLWYEWRRPRPLRPAAGPEGSDGHDRPDGHDQPDGHGHSDGHGHVHREPRISWLLILPLLGLMLVVPPALGSYSANRSGTALQPPLAFPALPAGDPVRLSVADYAGRAVFDHGRSLGGRRIQITGFITLDRGGAPYLARMGLNCCAADAQPVKVGLKGKVPPVVQPDSWFEVTGTFTGEQIKDPINDGPIPYIDVSRARPVPVPDDPYEN